MNSEQEKFLNENGLRILWNQISMQDYPNNTALTSIINTLNTNKADKVDIPNIDTTLSKSGAAADAKITGEAINNLNDLVQTQVNWEQNDETAVDFIQNRTHYKTQIDFTIIENKTVEFDVTFVGETSWTGTADIKIDKEMPAPIAENNIITAIINGVEWTAPVEYNSDKDVLHAEIYDWGGNETLDILFDQYNIEYPILRRISITHQGETPFDYNNFTLSLYTSGTSVIQIPLEYIPVDKSLNHPISQQKTAKMVNEVRGQIPHSYYDLNDIPCYAKESESVFLNEVYFADNDRLDTVESNWRMSWYTMFKIKGQLYPRKQYYVDQYGDICYYYCGNGALIDNTGVAELEDTGENFVIYANAESNVFTAYYNGEIDGEYGFVIYGVTPEEVKELDERCIPDTIARVSEISELSKEVFYVDFTDNGDGTYQANKNVVEVYTAYVSGADVKARITYDGMLLIVPMCIIEENFVAYGGATDTMTMYILHQGTQASVSMKELALKSSVDELNEWVQSVDDNIGTCIPMVMTGNVGQIPVATSVLNGVPNGWGMIDLPSGGGDTLEFIKTIKLTEEVSAIKINTDADGNPLNLKRIVVAVETVGGTPNENKSNYWVHPNSINAGAIRIDVAQGVYATGASVSSVIDIQMITDGVYLLNSACNGTPKQKWAGYNSEPTIKEINFGVSTEGYTFGVNTVFHVMGVKA